VPITRDPLSERYDRAAGKLVGRALARPGSWQTVTVPRPRGSSRIMQLMREGGLELEATDAGGLTAWERAFQRSAYYVFRGGPGGRGNDRWSMQRRWGPRHAGGRFFAVRVSPRDVGYRAAARKPARDRYTANPDLRSGGQGSGVERFRKGPAPGWGSLSATKAGGRSGGPRPIGGDLI
jgi:hypothetical protein